MEIAVTRIARAARTHHCFRIVICSPSPSSGAARLPTTSSFQSSHQDSFESPGQVSRVCAPQGSSPSGGEPQASKPQGKRVQRSNTSTNECVLALRHGYGLVGGISARGAVTYRWDGSRPSANGGPSMTVGYQG